MTLNNALYLTQWLDSLQEPYKFLTFMGGIFLIIALLFLDRLFENRKLIKAIKKNIKEKKENDKNCCVLYKGKIY